MKEYVARKKKLMKVVYGRWYEKFMSQADENGKFHDDRGIYCAIYEQIDDVLDSVESAKENVGLYVALNRYIDTERETLDRIIEVFKNR